MATKRQAACWLFAMALSHSTWGQSTPGAPRDSFYQIDGQGKAVFTQVIRWQGDPNALEYEVKIVDPTDAVMVDQRTADTSLGVQLPPGSYRYQITTYNLLGQPEAATPWVGFEVLKAEQPEVSSASPQTIYLDALDTHITIRGSRLLEHAKIALVDKKGNVFWGNVTQRHGEREIVVVFPGETYQPGDYTARVENPGGLSATAADTIRIRLQSPLDVLVAVGYSPFWALADPWFLKTWSPAFHPLGAQAQLDVLFIKGLHDAFGAEGAAEFRRLTGGITNASLQSDFLLWGGNALWIHRYSRQLHQLVRLGGGLSQSQHSFDYAGVAGPETTSADPFARAGAALQIFFPWKLYSEAGVDVSAIFFKDHMALGLSPRLSVGYQLY